jgi:hypothetical protein
MNTIQASSLMSVSGRYETSLYQRTFKHENLAGCPNILRSDQDRCSSINIRQEYLSCNDVWTAYHQFTDNLRQTSHCKLISAYGGLAESPHVTGGGSLLVLVRGEEFTDPIQIIICMIKGLGIRI